MAPSRKAAEKFLFHLAVVLSLLWYTGKEERKGKEGGEESPSSLRQLTAYSQHECSCSHTNTLDTHAAPAKAAYQFRLIYQFA